MVDRDLAELYGVETKRLNEAVKRNIARFPADFMFKLNDNEFLELVANCDRFKKLLNIAPLCLMLLMNMELQCFHQYLRARKPLQLIWYCKA